MKQQKINKAMRLLDNKFRVDFNSVRINIHNKLPHELAKTKLTYLLIVAGKRVITEAIFEGGGRADIFVPEDNKVYEVLHSETLRKAKEKLSYYPKEIKIDFYTTEEILNEEFLL